MVVMACFVFKKAEELAYHNIMGDKKIDGKWVRVSYPDHYTFPGIMLGYGMAGCVVVVGYYVIFALSLEFSGLSDKYGIITGIKYYLYSSHS